MIYFDNAATTCVFPEVVEAMQDAMQVTYGNPSAKHMKGIEAENKVKAAQELIAKTQTQRNLIYIWGNRIKQYSDHWNSNGKSPQRKAHYYDKGRTCFCI